MELLESYIGTPIYVGGKAYGRVTDFLIDTDKKRISGIIGITTVGFFRQRFLLKRAGILSFSENGVIADRHFIKSNKYFNEEISQFSCSRQNKPAAYTVGSVYFEPKNLTLTSVSVKKGVIDDLVYGRDIVDIENVFFTPKGKISRISED